MFEVSWDEVRHTLSTSLLSVCFENAMDGFRLAVAKVTGAERNTRGTGDIHHESRLALLTTGGIEDCTVGPEYLSAGVSCELISSFANHTVAIGVMLLAVDDWSEGNAFVADDVLDRLRRTLVTVASCSFNSERAVGHTRQFQTRDGRTQPHSIGTSHAFICIRIHSFAVGNCSNQTSLRLEIPIEARCALTALEEVILKRSWFVDQTLSHSWQTSSGVSRSFESTPATQTTIDKVTQLTTVRDVGERSFEALTTEVEIPIRKTFVASVESQLGAIVCTSK